MNTNSRIQQVINRIREMDAVGEVLELEWALTPGEQRR